MYRPAHAGGATNDGKLVAVAGLFRIGDEFFHEAEMFGEKSASTPGVTGRLRHVGGEPLFVEDVVEVFEFCLGKVEIFDRVGG